MRKCNHHTKIELLSFVKQIHKELYKDAEQPQKVSRIIFLVATKRLYKSVCPLGRILVSKLWKIYWSFGTFSSDILRLIYEGKMV